MPEPHSTIVAGALAGAGVSTVTLFLGAQVDALAVGLVAAVFVSIWLETIDNKIKAASAVLFASLLAGYGSPIAAAWLASSMPSIAGNLDSVRMLLALVIGGAAPSMVPILLRAARKKGEGL